MPTQPRVCVLPGTVASQGGKGLFQRGRVALFHQLSCEFVAAQPPGKSADQNSILILVSTFSRVGGVSDFPEPAAEACFWLVGTLPGLFHFVAEGTTFVHIQERGPQMGLHICPRHIKTSVNLVIGGQDASDIALQLPAQ